MIAHVMITILLSAVGADQTAAASSEGAPETKKAERKICRQATVLGSRVSQKVTCGTKSEWAIRERESQHFLKKATEGTYTPDGPI